MNNFDFELQACLEQLSKLIFIHKTEGIMSHKYEDILCGLSRKISRLEREYYEEIDEINGV